MNMHQNARRSCSSLSLYQCPVAQAHGTDDFGHFRGLVRLMRCRDIVGMLEELPAEICGDGITVAVEGQAETCLLATTFRLVPQDETALAVICLGG